MLEIATPAVPYADPWAQPLAQRLRMLSSGRRPRVAYYYEEANTSTFRYRAYNMVQALADDPEGPVGASYFFRADLAHVDEIAERADVLVICRSCYDDSIALLISRLRARGKRVHFDVDDLVFDPDRVHLIMRTLAVPTDGPQAARHWEHWFQYVARLGATLRACDGGITTNEFLATHMRAYSGLPVAVVPNFMNREQVELSARVFEDKQRRAFRGDGTLVLGYFSGTPSHQLDFAVAEAAAARLVEADDRLRLMMVGYIEPGPALARLGARLIRRPFQDYVNLQRLIGSVEFNLMPLQSNVFTDCKSELKYFEAAAVGTLSIASPSVNYAACIEHGRNAWLARAHEWERRLREAMAALDDYPRMATQARDHALERYTWRTQSGAVLRALEPR